MLADGVREVAAGDLRPKAVLQSRDELGGLTRDFADMTQQLADARAEVQRGMAQVDASRANLQTILDNLTAGVMVLDDQGVIHSANPGATRILRAPMAAHLNQPLAAVPGLEDFAQAVLAQFQSLLAERQLHGLDHWQQSFELNGAKPGLPADTISLIARGAEMPGGAWLLVFDDMSEVVSAQRAQAWGEVARRLAHEIKNPLTPIQLSAERLAMKLDGKLASAEQTVLTKSVKTIVDQVDAMKRLVNEFRDYARLPAAELRPLQLNQVITDVLQLYPSGTTLAPVLAQLDPLCPLVMGDAHQLRQGLDPGGAVSRRRGPQRRHRQRGHPLGRGLAPCAPERARQRPRLPRAHPQTRVRALRHHQATWHRLGPGRGEENCRRAPCPHRPQQPGKRRPRAGGRSVAIIRSC